MQNIGGQAVIEGVLIRNENKIGIATLKNKKIKTVLWKLKERPKFLRFFLIRGIYNLIETLIIGIKALNYSADQQLEKEEKVSLLQLIITLIVSLGVGILIFKFFPLFLTEMLNRIFHLENSVLFALLEGFLKLIIFVLYVLLISKMKDVKRIFEFHGAEHKVVNAYENKDLGNVRKYRVVHERCGSAFVFLVLFLTIVVYSFIPTSFDLWEKLVYRLLLLLPIISLGYEILKFNSKYPNIISKVLVYPGLLLQKLTVTEPNEEQVKVAMEALKRVLG